MVAKSFQRNIWIFFYILKHIIEFLNLTETKDHERDSLDISTVILAISFINNLFANSQINLCIFKQKNHNQII